MWYQVNTGYGLTYVNQNRSKVLYFVKATILSVNCPMASEGTRKNEETFLIRRATSLADLQWVVKMATEEDILPREKEAECYFSAGLTPYFYIGELKGERISCMSLVRHGESSVIGGYNIVHKSYRGQGYGRKMMEVGLKNLSDQCNIQTLAPRSSINPYQKHGYQSGWIVNSYQFTASRGVEGLASCQLPPSVEQILPASQVDFEKLFAYSADMLGSSQTCKLLLAAWLCHLQESSWAAIDKNGEMVGYLIMSKTTRFTEDGYCIAPFFADSPAIARCLLKVAVEFAGENYPNHNNFAEIPVDYNPEGVSILEKEIGAKLIVDYTFMANKEIPNKPLSKVFSFASTQVL